MERQCQISVEVAVSSPTRRDVGINISCTRNFEFERALDQVPTTDTFDLSLEDSIPEFLSRNSLASVAFLLNTTLRILHDDFMHIWCLVRAEQGPFAILFETFHAVKMLGPIYWKLTNAKNLQKIEDPESVEEIASMSFFLSVVLAEVEEFKDVGVPWLDVHGKRAWTLIATLIHITSSGVVDLQHWHNSV